MNKIIPKIVKILIVILLIINLPHALLNWISEDGTYIPFSGKIYHVDRLISLHSAAGGKKLMVFPDYDGETRRWYTESGEEMEGAEQILNTVNELRYLFWLPDLSWFTFYPDWEWSVGWGDNGFNVSEDCRWISGPFVNYYLRPSSREALKEVYTYVSENGDPRNRE